MTSPTPLPGPALSGAKVKHRTTQIDGIGVFYREAGPSEAPVVLASYDASRGRIAGETRERGLGGG